MFTRPWGARIHEKFCFDPVAAVFLSKATVALIANSSAWCLFICPTSLDVWAERCNTTSERAIFAAGALSTAFSRWILPSLGVSAVHAFLQTSIVDIFRNGDVILSGRFRRIRYSVGIFPFVLGIKLLVSFQPIPLSIPLRANARKLPLPGRLPLSLFI